MVKKDSENESKEVNVGLPDVDVSLPSVKKTVGSHNESFLPDVVETDFLSESEVRAREAIPVASLESNSIGLIGLDYNEPSDDKAHEIIEPLAHRDPNKNYHDDDSEETIDSESKVESIDDLDSLLAGNFEINNDESDFEDDDSDNENNNNDDYVYSGSSFHHVDEDDDPLAGFNIDNVLNDAIDMGASDVHINSDDQVSFTILGEIHRQEKYGEIISNVTRRLQQTIISHVLEADFVEELELDTSYVIRRGRHSGRRLRLSIGKSFGNIFMVFRVIADQVPTPKELGITGSLLDWCTLPNGLVMMNGPTGSGKSTTLASLLKEIQLTRPQKIITIEKPIEFVFGTEGKALVTQREVGKDARTFASALTSAMRQAPDIIMVGEVRNRVEVNELLRAAETGHLAISTMHTNSAPATINRIKSLYDGEEQMRILGSLSDVSRGFANQVLLKTIDGESRFAVREVLDVDETVSKLIMNGDVEGIRQYQIHHGITMEHELVKAVNTGKVSSMVARSQSAYPRYFDELIKNSESSV